MRARRLITAVFLRACAKLAEPERARLPNRSGRGYWRPKGLLGRGIEMAAVVGLDAFFTGWGNRSRFLGRNMRGKSLSHRRRGAVRFL
ncbi:Hypothetical protein NGAL_HAMBI490_53430 [Neorhizobium galegae bv. officinalis]|nr:Hypothetical protein NGAL_HAMBI490_53430 [Neorhizobium galegae bv. officinalis]